MQRIESETCTNTSYLPKDVALQLLTCTVYTTTQFFYVIITITYYISAVPPNITMGPVTRTVVSPNNVSFSCMADGVPAPDILWLLFNNNSMLVSLDEVEAPPEVLRIDSQVLEDNRTTVSSLNIFGVQPVFANNYTCRTVNQLGVDEAVAQLIVHGMYV